MKKVNKAFFTAIIICIASGTWAQHAKWFFAFSGGIQVAGPSASIKKSLSENGYNVPATLFFVKTYPSVIHRLSWLGIVGRDVSKRVSAYLEVGRAGAAEVEGYDGHFGNNIKYQLFQVTGGYQLSFSSSRSKIGIGPSLFILQTGKNNHELGDNNITDKHRAIKPGLSLMGRVPFGKGRKLIGLELFGELNIASNVKFEDFNSYYNRPEPYNATITGGVIGLSIAFLKKTATAP